MELRRIERLARVLAALCLLPAGAGADPARVANGLVAFYPFTEGAGFDVDDYAPEGPRDALIATGKLSWLSGSGQNGIELQGGRVGTPHLPDVEPPNLPVIAALKATGHSTFELWIDAESLTEHDADNRVFSLGPFSIRQADDDLEIRLLHTGKSGVGKPWLVTNNGPLGAGLTHLVHTFDGSVERLYVDGVENPVNVAVSGTYANWSSEGRVAFGTRSEISYDSLYTQSWHGSIRLAAVYDRALAPGEVQQNLAAGPDLPLVYAGPDRATQGLPGQPTQSVTLGGASAVVASWSVLSAPPGGVVGFDDPSQPVTGAQFSENGSYELALTATDGSASAIDRTRVAVNVLSSQIAAPQNLFPADAAARVANRPTLEIACHAGATGARFVIAQDPAFTSIVDDSGESSNYTCSYVAGTALPGDTVHYWSARVRDSEGKWSDWSTPTQFTTAHSASLTSLLLQHGVGGYAGAGDTDVRGFAEDPFNPIRVWNQGAQDVVRTGRRPIRVRENYRSLLRFEIDGIVDPNSVVNAYLELTGYEHEPETDFFFEADNSFYEVLVPWGEGTGLTRAPLPGEASWLHSEYPTTWNFPGVGGVGTDRAAQALMRGRFTSQVGHKTFWSSQAFLDAVRAWVADPAANHGLLLQADDEVVLQNLNLASKEHPDPTWRPRLVLELIDRVVLTTPGDDIAAGDTTSLVVTVHDAFGNPVADGTTQVIFTPTGSAAITGVAIGTGDGAYGAPGVPEQVTVSGGIASITLTDAKAETFTVSIGNDSGLSNPDPDSIAVSAGTAAQLVLITPGTDFRLGASTSLVLEVQDAFGNRVDDDTTQVGFTPTWDAAIRGVVTGTGDGAYGVAGEPEQVTVSAGVVSVTVGSTRVGGFSIAFSNSAGLQDPPPDVIVTQEIADTVLIGHGPDGIVSRYDAQTGQSEPALDAIGPTRDVAADAVGNIYTTREVFVDPGFATDLARNGILVDTFPGAPGGLAVDSDSSVLVGHGDASGVVSRYDPSTEQSSAELALSAPTHDVAVGPGGEIYTTTEVFVDPGFATDLARDGAVLETFPGAPRGLAVDTFGGTSVLVGHGDETAAVTRYETASAQITPVLSFDGLIDDIAVSSTGGVYATADSGSGTRLTQDGADAELLPGAPGGLATVPLPEAGSAAFLAGLGLLFALRRATARGGP